jgi:hypothetical protein
MRAGNTNLVGAPCAYDELLMLSNFISINFRMTTWTSAMAKTAKFATIPPVVVVIVATLGEAVEGAAGRHRHATRERHLRQTMADPLLGAKVGTTGSRRPPHPPPRRLEDSRREKQPMAVIKTVTVIRLKRRRWRQPRKTNPKHCSVFLSFPWRRRRSPPRRWHR